MSDINRSPASIKGDSKTVSTVEAGVSEERLMDVMVSTDTLPYDGGLWAKEAYDSVPHLNLWKI